MKKEKTVLVCITPQESSKQLVKAGRAIAQKHGANLEVVSVLPLMEKDGQYNFQAETVEKLYQTAKKEKGEMAMLKLKETKYDDSVAAAAKIIERISLLKNQLALSRSDSLESLDDQIKRLREKRKNT